MTGVFLVSFSRLIDNYLLEELYIYLGKSVYASGNLPIHLYVHLIFIVSGIVIIVSGLVLAWASLDYRRDIISILIPVGDSFFRLISLILSGLLSTLLVYLIFLSLVTPKALFNYSDPKQVAAAQILACVGLAGMLGGVVKVIFSSRAIDEQTDMSTFRVSFRKVLFNCIGSLFVACTSFLLIRAGVLKSVDVDTFNPYGVTGIAGVTGFFSDQIVSRLTTVYTNIFNIDSSKNKLDSKD